MTEKPSPKVTILFLAILPISAWVAVIYFALVIAGATGTILETFVRFLQLGS